jgi:hypothetical protein
MPIKKPELHKGTDRLAIVGEKRTVKLPVINLFTFIKQSREQAGRNGVGSVIHDLRTYRSDQMGLRRLLLRGVFENKRESRLARDYPKVVAPTRTVLGLCNIQPTLKPVTSSENEIWSAFVDELNGMAPVLGHMMEDTSNLGKMPDGNVVFVDGGSRGIGRLLPDKQTQIVNALSSIAVLESQKITT